MSNPVPAVAQGLATSTSSASGTFTAAFSSNVTKGNFLYVAVYVRDASVLPTLADSLGTNYSLISSNSFNNHKAAIYGGFAPANGTCALTATAAGGDLFGFAAQEISNTNGVTDVTPIFLNNPSGGANPPAITTVTANDIILYSCLSDHGAQNFTSSSPIVVDASNVAVGQITQVAAHIIGSVAGTFTPTLNYQSSAPEFFFVVALQPTVTPANMYYNLTSVLPLPVRQSQKGGSNCGAAQSSGFNAIPVTLDFTKSNGYTISGKALLDSGRIGGIQGVYIDASNSSIGVTLTFEGTGQVIAVKPYTQGYYPVLAPNPFVLTAVCAGGPSALNLQFLDFPIQPCNWVTQ